MTPVARTVIGILLSIIGMVCFLVFMWKGLWVWVDYGYIAASIASLFAIFIGGLLSSLLGRGVGEGMTTFGFVGTLLPGLFAYLAVSKITMTVDNLGEIFMFLICGTLAGIFLSVMVFGLGILFGSLIAPGIGGADSDTNPPPPDEPGEE